ncbi:MAG: cupin domain-containing protein, partial [Methylococcaceae bacterium]
KAKSISIDYAIMEHSTKAAVLPVDYQWLDIGNWAALANMLPEDQQGNAVKGNVELLESSNNLVYSDHRLTTVIGMQDTIVVATRDAVLVVPKNEAEKVKNLVNLLEEKQHSTVSETSKIIQTWENDKQLDVGPPLCINRIVLKSGKTVTQHVLAQQAHHWVVVEGVAEVTIDDDIKIVEANHSIYIPQGAIYRLANRQNINLVLIEILIEISTPNLNA